MEFPYCTNTNSVVLINEELELVMMTCNDRATEFGFNSFDFGVVANITNTEYKLLFNFTFEGQFVAVTTTGDLYSGNAEFNFASAIVSPKIPGIQARVRGNLLTVHFIHDNNTTQYNIKVFFNSSGENLVIRQGITDGVILTLIINAGSILISPSPDGESSIPNVTGHIYMIHNGKQICEIDYATITQSYDCNTLKKETNFYVQYYPGITTTLKGSGCTIESKVGKERLVLVVAYSVLRMILSIEVMDFCFTPKSLRQRYYKQFLECLKKSDWSAFLQYFMQPVVSDLWKLFKK